jgi:hypothetical protein
MADERGVERAQFATDSNSGRTVGLDVEIRSAITDACLEELAELRLASSGLGTFGMVYEPSMV